MLKLIRSLNLLINILELLFAFYFRLIDGISVDYLHLGELIANTYNE